MIPCAATEARIRCYWIVPRWRGQPLLGRKGWRLESLLGTAQSLRRQRTLADCRIKKQSKQKTKIDNWDSRDQRQALVLAAVLEAALILQILYHERHITFFFVLVVIFNYSLHIKSYFKICFYEVKTWVINCNLSLSLWPVEEKLCTIFMNGKACWWGPLICKDIGRGH